MTKTDLTRLRLLAKDIGSSVDHLDGSIAHDAADEIERLRDELEAAERLAKIMTSAAGMHAERVVELEHQRRALSGIVLTVVSISNGEVTLRADPWFFPPVHKAKSGDTITLHISPVEPEAGKCEHGNGPTCPICIPVRTGP